MLPKIGRSTSQGCRAEGLQSNDSKYSPSLKPTKMCLRQLKSMNLPLIYAYPTEKSIFSECIVTFCFKINDAKSFGCSHRSPQLPSAIFPMLTIF
jgi:hypothetical protein